MTGLHPFYFTNKNPLMVFIACAILLMPATLWAQFEPPLIRVSGTAEAHAAPDQAQFSLHFEAIQLTAQKAREQVDLEISALLDALEGFAIKEKSLDTSQTQIHPQYNYRNNAREFLGYQVSRQAQFILEDLNQMDKLLAALSKSGAARLNPIQFGLSKPNQTQRQALTKAIKRAKKTAQKIAQEFDVKLGKIHSVSLASHNAPLHPRAKTMMVEMAASDTAPSYQQKDLSVSVTVDAAFTFD